MKVLSLFSGVGGFDLGLEAAGMRTVGLCEIDPRCRSVLRRHWPGVPIYEDVSTLTAERLLADGVRPDVVAFGSPCQDLSVAGKRAGLAGARSGLFGEAMRIIRELRGATHGRYPTWAVWENVVGALSSTQGDDFGAVVDSMADAGAVVIEWAVLDAQFFGVPQRRRRVFLVAGFDPRASDRCPNPLLPVGPSRPRDPAKGRQPRTGASAPASSGARGDGIVGTLSVSDLVRGQTNNQTLDADLLQVVEAIPLQDGRDIEKRQNGLGIGDHGDPAYTLDTTGAQAVAQPVIVFEADRRDGIRLHDETMPTLTAFMGTGGNNVPSVGQPIPIQNTVIGRSDTAGPNGPGHGEEGGPMFTLDTTGPHAVTVESSDPLPTEQEIIAFSHTQGFDPQPSTEHWPTLRSQSEGHAVAFQPGSMIRQGGGVWDDLAPTLRAEAKGGDNEPHIAIEIPSEEPDGQLPLAFDTYNQTLSDTAQTIRSARPTNDNVGTVIQDDGYNQKVHVDEPSVTLRIGRDSSDFVAQPLPTGSAEEESLVEREIASTLTARYYKSANAEDGGQLIPNTHLAVRRLTPLECERLMGWPDDHTRWNADGTELADSHRYRMCGNGIASPVSEWVARQILNAQDLIRRFNPKEPTE